MSILPNLKLFMSVLRFVLMLCLACLSLSVLAENRFEILEDGQEVLDTRTQLIWRRCSEGMVWQNGDCQGTATYWMWHEALALSAQVSRETGKSWRVPNIKELFSIIDPAQSAMAIDLQVFPATPNSQFWTSSHYMQDAFFGWIVHFWYGSAYFTYLEDLSAVRLVRDAPR